MLGAFMTAATLLPAPGLPAPPLVAATWMMTLALVAEPHVRSRRRRIAEPPTIEAIPGVRTLRPVGELAGPG
jgi:hypothetical protein